MKLSKICKNTECEAVFYKKDGTRMMNWKQQNYCCTPCQVYYKNKIARMRNTRVMIRAKKITVTSADHVVVKNFISGYMPRG